MKNMKITEECLETMLNNITNNHYEVPADTDPFQLIKEVCYQLGNPNPVLRDDLGYSLLAQWIYKKRLFNNEQLRELYLTMNSDKMWFYRIGETNTNSVLMRSFTSLGITLLLLIDSDSPFLTDEELSELVERTVNYCSYEKDLRGYHEEYGWMHAAAHVADVLNAFAKHARFSKIHTSNILHAISKVMENALEVFQYEEDERLARALVNLIASNHLSLNDLMFWFEQVNMECEPYIAKMRRRMNWKLLYRSCISQLEKRELIKSTDLSYSNRKFDNSYL